MCVCERQRRREEVASVVKWAVGENMIGEISVGLKG